LKGGEKVVTEALWSQMAKGEPRVTSLAVTPSYSMMLAQQAGVQLTVTIFIVLDFA
jgi:hypothetical protein